MTALLEKLRSSQAWAEIQNEPSPPEPAVPRALVQGQVATPNTQPDLLKIGNNDSNLTANKDATSVANLLSQLSSEAPSNSPGYSRSPQSYSSSTPPSTSTAVPNAFPRKDVRSYTFQQSLPYLAQLSEDPLFLDAISKVNDPDHGLDIHIVHDTT